MIVEENNTLNFTKGTIQSKRFAEVADKILLDERKKSDVTELYRIKRNERNELKHAGTIILTIDRCNLL